jgi:hypothetical protein
MFIVETTTDGGRDGVPVLDGRYGHACAPDYGSGQLF